tara:strand:- start:3682 stop:4203 length:522 start_codon:yes stop_codon:yes gene_type:complete
VNAAARFFLFFHLHLPTSVRIAVEKLLSPLRGFRDVWYQPPWGSRPMLRAAVPPALQNRETIIPAIRGQTLAPLSGGSCGEILCPVCSSFVERRIAEAKKRQKHGGQKDESPAAYCSHLFALHLFADFYSNQEKPGTRVSACVPACRQPFRKTLKRYDFASAVHSLTTSRFGS